RKNSSFVQVLDQRSFIRSREVWRLTTRSKLNPDVWLCRRPRARNPDSGPDPGRTRATPGLYPGRTRAIPGPYPGRTRGYTRAVPGPHPGLYPGPLPGPPLPASRSLAARMTRPLIWNLSLDELRQEDERFLPA